MTEEKKSGWGRVWEVLNAPIALGPTSAPAEAPAEAPPVAEAPPQAETPPVPRTEDGTPREALLDQVLPVMAPEATMLLPQVEFVPETVAPVAPPVEETLPPIDMAAAAAFVTPPIVEPEPLPLPVVELAPPPMQPESSPPAPPEPLVAEAAPEPPVAAKPSWWEILNTPITFGPTEDVAATETLMVKLRLKMGYADTPEEAAAIRAHWLEKFQERLQQTREQFVARIDRLTRGRTSLDDEMLEELEDILLSSDVGVHLTDNILADLQGQAKQRRFLPEEVMPSVVAYLKSQLAPGDQGIKYEPGKLTVIMLVGVNGTGKTTTAGKLALRERVLGRKVMLAAADTFRAAATEQLRIWADRTGVEIVHHHEGADAGAVVFDALQAARARKADVIIIDTAGRLHTKFNLMEEMKKLRRVIDREAADAHIEVLLVLDANTGQNGLRQAEAFGKAVGLTGVILTKLDGTAKGGVIFAIQSALELPIKLIGIGEGPEDLQEFDSEMFVQALFTKPEEAPAGAT